MDVLLRPGEPDTREQRVPIADLRWYFSFFVVSGFCGLVYEIVWLRLAMASFGVTTALASIVISMFMAGLGLGSWGAGVLTRRVLATNGSRALRLYSIAELCVGISSLAVPLELKLGRQLLLHIGSFATWQSWLYYLLAGSWIAITLVPWCTCMGSTFPLLMAVIRQAARPASERSFSYLYVANVFGALLGTLTAAFVLIEMLGFRGTLYVAGILNALLALSAFAMSRTQVLATPLVKTVPAEASKPRLSTPATKTSPWGPRLYGLSPNAVLIFLFTTGFVSMGMEVVWIREFTPYLGPFVYAFARILLVYLLATLLGSHRYRTRAQSLPARGSASAWSYLALFAILPVVAADPLLPVGGAESAGLRLSMIAFFCAVAGFLTPLLVDAWSSGNPDRAGTAYAVNVVGSIIGPLVAGFWLLPWLGERKAVLVLSLPLFAIAALTALRKEVDQSQPIRKQRLTFAVATVAAVVLFSVSHDFESRYAVREVRRDYAATVIATGTGFDRGLLVNGANMTGLTPDNKYMVDLPLAFLGRSPQNGLIICFGMGTGFRSLLSWGIPATAVDLSPSVPKLFGYFHEDAPQLMSSPLARIVVDDGRRFLDGSTQTYDVIVIDPPPPPQSPGTSLLYSREFYDVIKKHLRKGGIMQLYLIDDTSDPAIKASTAKSMMQSLPYVRAFPSVGGDGIYFLASSEPIPATKASVLASRLPPAAASDFVEWGPTKTVTDQFQFALSRELNMEQLIAQAPQVPALKDDAPINEYFLLRRWFHYYR
jgi:predicted membrane-bound spermidine synthase